MKQPNFNPYSTGQYPYSEESTVSGIVESTGVRLAGEGFTVVRNAIGDYTITFTPPFVLVPSIQVTPENGNFRAPQTFLATNQSTRIIMRDQTAATADSRFHITATPNQI